MATTKTITINQLAALCDKWDYSHGSYVDESIDRAELNEGLQELEWSNLPNVGVEEVDSDDTIENGIHQEGVALYRLGTWEVFIYHNNAETNVQFYSCKDKKGSLRSNAEDWYSNCDLDDIPSIVLQQLGIESVAIEFDEKSVTVECEEISGTFTFNPYGDELKEQAIDLVEERLGGVEVQVTEMHSCFNGQDGVGSGIDSIAIRRGDWTAIFVTHIRSGKQGYGELEHSDRSVEEVARLAAEAPGELNIVWESEDEDQWSRMKKRFDDWS